MENRSKEVMEAGTVNFSKVVFPWEGTYRCNSVKAEMVIKKLELEDAREKIELQVNQSVYKVNEAGKQLIASTKNMEKAEENLRYANLDRKSNV